MGFAGKLFGGEWKAAGVTDGGRQRTGDRRQMSEGGGQKTEGRCQRTEDTPVKYASLSLA